MAWQADFGRVQIKIGYALSLGTGGVYFPAHAKDKQEERKHDQKQEHNVGFSLYVSFAYSHIN